MTTKYQRLMLAATSEEATLPGACWEWDGAHRLVGLSCSWAVGQ